MFECLVDAKYILDSFKNGREIIFDKVKSGSYLVPDSLNQVYKVIVENTSENALFYTRLFNNYSRYYQIPEEMFLFISNSNKLALGLFIKRLNIGHDQVAGIIQQFTKDRMDSLASSVIKMLNYLRVRFNVPLSNDIGNLILKRLFILGYSLKLELFIKLIKILLEIYNSNIISGTNSDGFDLVQDYLVNSFGNSNSNNINNSSNNSSNNNSNNSNNS